MKIVKLKKFLILVLVTVLGLGLFNALTTAPRHTPKNTPQIQGVWLTHVGNSFISYTGQTDNVFHQLSKLNFNRVYVDVYNGGTTYSSEYAPRNNLISFPFTDPLKAAIKEGERQGLSIYAWYEYGMMLSLNSNLAKQHPDWVLETADQETIIDDHLWLDPANSEVQGYFINMFTEVAQKYPNLYGIQLDDHWSIPIQFGNQAKIMTELTRKVSEAVKKVNPNLIISISPNHPSFAYNKYSQNWLAWVRQKLVDEVIVQIYRQTSQEVAKTLTHSGLQEASDYVPVAVGIYTGSFSQFKSLDEVKKQIEVATKYGYGYSLFCWEFSLGPLRFDSRQQKEAAISFSMSLSPVS